MDTPGNGKGRFAGKGVAVPVAIAMLGLFLLVPLLRETDRNVRRLAAQVATRIHRKNPPEDFVEAFAAAYRAAPTEEPELAASDPACIVWTSGTTGEPKGCILSQRTQRLRAGEVPGCRPDLPVIVVTACALAGDRERFLALGANDYLPKPIDVPTVLTAVHRLL